MTDQITAETDIMFDQMRETRAIHGSQADEALWPLPSVTEEEIEWYRRAFANPQRIVVSDEEFDALQALMADDTPRPAPKLDKLMRRPRVFSS